MKHNLCILLIFLYSATNAQSLYNNGAKIISQSGSYWVFDNNDFTIINDNTSSLTQFHNLTITSNASVTLAGPLSAESGNFLYVSGNLINNAGISGLILKSNANGTATLLNNTSGVLASVEQYLIQEQWHYMGIPVTTVSNVQDIFDECYVLTINEENANDGTNTGWEYLVPFDEMQRATGYAIRYGWSAANSPKPSNKTIIFTGELNAETIEPNLSYTDASHGWNFISNPFPCTIDWDYISNNNGLTNTNDAIYVYDPTSGNYATYINGVSGGAGTQDQYIAPMQGFFVRSTAAGSVSFNANSKTSDISILKSASINPIINLAIIQEKSSDHFILQIADKSTNKFDSHYDAYKLLSSDSPTPELYAVFNGNQYSINTIPEITDDLVIPIEIRIKKTAEHKLVISDMQNFSFNYPLAIYDEEGNFKTDLEKTDYVFTGIEGETIKLFLAFTISNRLFSNNIQTSDISLSTNEYNLVINRLNNIPYKVIISNISGQIIYSEDVKTDKLFVPAPKQGIYTVTVLKENRIVFNGKTVITF